MARDAPITLSLTGMAAAEIRRLARALGGPAIEDNVVTLATACALRGVVEIERDQHLQRLEARKQPLKGKRKRVAPAAESTDDNADDAVPPHEEPR